MIAWGVCRGAHWGDKFGELNPLFIQNFGDLLYSKSMGAFGLELGQYQNAPYINLKHNNHTAPENVYSRNYIKNEKKL